MNVHVLWVWSDVALSPNFPAPFSGFCGSAPDTCNLKVIPIASIYLTARNILLSTFRTTLWISWAVGMVMSLQNEDKKILSSVFLIGIVGHYIKKLQFVVIGHKLSDFVSSMDNAEDRYTCPIPRGHSLSS